MAIGRNKLLSHAFEDLNEEVAGTSGSSETLEEVDVDSEVQSLEEINDAINKLQISQDKLEEVHEQQEANLEAMESGEQVEGSTIVLPEPEAEQSVQVEQMSEGIDNVMHQESLVLENVVGRLTFNNIDEMFAAFGAARKKTSISKESLNNPKELLKEKVALYKASHESVGGTIKNIGKAIWEAIKKAFAMLKDFIKSVFNKTEQIPKMVTYVKNKTEVLENVQVEELFKNPSLVAYAPSLVLGISGDTYGNLEKVVSLGDAVCSVLVTAKNFLSSGDININSLEELTKPLMQAVEVSKNVTELSKKTIELVDSNPIMAYKNDRYIVNIVFAEKDRILTYRFSSFYADTTGLAGDKEKISNLGTLHSSTVSTSTEIKKFFEDYLRSKYKNFKEVADDYIGEVGSKMSIYKDMMRVIRESDKQNKLIFDVMMKENKDGMDPELYQKIYKDLSHSSRTYIDLTKIGTRILVSVMSTLAVIGKTIDGKSKIPQ